MNNKTLTLKIDGFTINLHSGIEESEEIGKKRLLLFVNCLKSIAMKPMIECFEKYLPELHQDVVDIIKRNDYML